MICAFFSGSWRLPMTTAAKVRVGRGADGRRFAVWAFCALLSGLPVRATAAAEDGECFGCHSDRALAGTNAAGRAVSVYVDKARYAASAHGDVSCAECHDSHDVDMATNPASRLFWRKTPETCGKCHEEAAGAFLRGVHGKAALAGERDAPVCTDCHRVHAPQPVGGVAAAAAPDTCGQCHGAQRIAARYGLAPSVVATYLSSFHGLAWQAGSPTVANCASCHGAHEVLRSTDPRSSVHPANLPATCGKCHPGIGTRLALDPIRIHSPPGAAEGKPWLVNFVSRLYIALIALVIGAMAVHNAADFIAKFRAHARRVREAKDSELRFTPAARCQHLSLVILFAVLAYTGFVHRFPDAWWSWPFQALDGGSAWRGVLHRVAGCAFTVLFAAHSILLVGTRDGRGYLRELWPRRHDFADLGRFASSRARLRATALPPRRFTYIEKAEYWALVWGSALMIVTGLMLVFAETVLRTMPKVWNDVAEVIHYYEAILATLAILVWHLYWVVFDPDEYPMNTAWLNGLKKKHSAARDAGAAVGGAKDA